MLAVAASPRGWARSILRASRAGCRWPPTTSGAPSRGCAGTAWARTSPSGCGASTIWLVLLLDTLLIAYGGTVLGAAAALLLSFPAAATFAPRWTVGPARRLLELDAHRAGARACADLRLRLRPRSLRRHAGDRGAHHGRARQAVRRGARERRAWPGGWRSAPPAGPGRSRCASACCRNRCPGCSAIGLLRFEINVREASVLGIVGAGGIGEELYLAVRQFEYPDISAILVLILAHRDGDRPALRRLRRRVIGERAA